MKIMDKKYKICLWGSDIPYSWEHIKEFGDEFDMFSIVRGRAFGYSFDIQITNPFKQTPFSTIFEILSIPRIMYLFLKYDSRCDCHLVHYLSPHNALAIAFLPLKKPIVYCAYGSDVRIPEGFHKTIVRKALRKVNVILAFPKSFYSKYIVSKYGIDERKIVPLLWYPLNPCFRRFDDISISTLTKKWNLTKKHVIFSPRATKEFYNHHLLIDGLGLLNKELKQTIQVVLTGFGDPEYRRRLVEMGKTKGVEVVDLERVLTREAMAEIYNISVITVGIPNADALGRSNLQAVMCGSILLLTKNNAAYGEIFKDEKYCKFVDLNAEDIAQGIKYILNNIDALKDEEERSTIMNIVNWEKNKSKIIECIKVQVEQKVTRGCYGRKKMT